MAKTNHNFVIIDIWFSFNSISTNFKMLGNAIHFVCSYGVKLNKQITEPNLIEFSLWMQIENQVQKVTDKC